MATSKPKLSVKWKRDEEFDKLRKRYHVASEIIHIRASEVSLDNPVNYLARVATPLDAETALTYGVAFQQGDIFPRITVARGSRAKRSFAILSGRHRFSGLVDHYGDGINPADIALEVDLLGKCDEATMTLLARASNMLHGLPLTPAEAEMLAVQQYVDHGTNQDELCELFHLQKAKLQTAIRRHHATRLLEDHRVKTDNLTQTQLTLLSGMLDADDKAEKMLVRVGHAVARLRPTTEETQELLRGVRGRKTVSGKDAFLKQFEQDMQMQKPGITRGCPGTANRKITRLKGALQRTINFFNTGDKGGPVLDLYKLCDTPQEFDELQRLWATAYAACQPKFTAAKQQYAARKQKEPSSTRKRAAKKSSLPKKSRKRSKAMKESAELKRARRQHAESR